MNEQLSPEAVSSLLERPMKVFTYDLIDSTNNQAKRLISAGLREPALLIADCQSAGKGRLGRSFYSPARTGLYMSVVLHPNAPAAEWLSITSAAAVAVCLAVESLSGLKPSIKWVNDVYLGERKVCGILTEAVTEPGSALMRSVVIGIGVNLQTTSFPDEIADRAASLFSVEAPAFSAGELAAAICNRLCALADRLTEASWLPLYRERSWLDGKQITYTDREGTHDARAVGIDEDGGLIVERSAGTRTVLRSGEVTVRLNPFFS